MQDSTPVALPPTPTSAPLRGGGWSTAGAGGGAARRRPKLKKLRIFLVALGLSLLAVVSTVFGMMMAVAGDLPALENLAQYRAAQNSVLIADDPRGTQIAKLTGNENRILLSETEISPNIKNAIVAIEDKRFYEHRGVDYQGIARALWQDIKRQKVVQGGSTITQQFVKNAVAAQDDRSIFQKLRESALAYHLERQWSKQKVLTQYLNSIYFGNGAWGVEAAVRTYFRGGQTFSQGDREALDVTPDQAALLAGMIASPAAYNPVTGPSAARERRDIVLRAMLDQGMIARQEYDRAIVRAIPAPDDIVPPRPDSTVPYFSSWITQQVVDRYGAGRVFGGGLKITTTLDPELQQAAEAAVERIQGIGPAASLVAIENRTGEVKAMVAGTDFVKRPFNLAVSAERQPGSAFKPFILVEALRQGVGPLDTFESKEKIFDVPGSADKNEKFVVHNYQDAYSGITTLASATAQSDNSVYAELGLRLGTRKIARLAGRMGIRTRISTNPAMTLGGLKQGVTPLEMAYAYSTIANRGLRVHGTLGPSERAPVAIQKVRTPGGRTVDENDRRTVRVFSPEAADQARSILEGVLRSGTGRSAAIGEEAAGKTGTTENYGDAWFVGFNKDWTVAVWVGYPDELRPMETEYGGKPVAGNTYPADIWRTFMLAAIGIRDRREAERQSAEEAKRLKEEQDRLGPGAPGVPGDDPAVPPAVEGGEERAAPATPRGGSPPSRGGPSPSAPGGPDRSAPAPAPPSPAPSPAPAPSPGSSGGAESPD